MISFHIRKYAKKDIEDIKALWNTIVDEGESYLYDEHFTIEEVDKMLKNQDAVYCAVNDNDKMVGFYILHPNFAGRGKHIANATYGVNKNYRGYGIGKMLGNHSIEISKELGFKAIQFNAVVSTNTGAIHLWENLGFEKIGEIPKAFKKDNGDIVSLFVYYKPLQ